LHRCKTLFIVLSYLSQQFEVLVFEVARQQDEFSTSKTTFFCRVTTNMLKKEQDNYKNIAVTRKFDNSMVQRNYPQIKQDIQDIIHS
jgi:hypothetical protein